MSMARFRTLSPRQGLLVLEACAELVAAKVLTSLLPFPRLVGWSSAKLGRGGSPQPSEMVWSVEAVAARMPFKALCLQQSVALQRMLRRRGYDARLRFGVTNSSRLEAHAWVTLGPDTLIGGEEAVRFRELAAWP